MSVQNYSSLDVNEPAEVILEKDHNVINESLVSEIDMMMKKYVDHLMHAVDGVNARLLQLETKTHNLESSMDDLKLSVGNNHGSTDGKLRQMESILREVQTGVYVIRDKQEIVEAQLQMAKLQVPKFGQPVETHNTLCADSTQTGISTAQNSLQQLPTVSFIQPPSTLAPPNAPPPPPPQQNVQSHVQLPNQFPQNQVPSVSQRESYFPPPGQTPENPSQRYEVPPQQQQPPSLPPLQQQYQLQYSQPPPPQPLPVLSAVNPSQLQPALGHRHEETQYIPLQSYLPSIRPPPSHPPQQFYGPPDNVYQPPSSKLTPGYPGSYGPSSGPGELYSYSSSPMKLQQLSSPAMGQSSGSGYPQLPTAQMLPHAPPIASGIGGGSGSGGTGNRVPIDDVIDKVTTMGFSQDLVRATVRKLTENGQSVDLNVVLDKLMNDGEGQPPQGWFGRFFILTEKLSWGLGWL
ncbi:transcriptional regulator DEF1-like [Forsythia ovata]|uniref:Transcriptional regulator DEF1-like n=1 Tax=Forsythia ovata TaxID=205694 RepID=A0ABD1UVE8_9LAMI